MRDRWPVPLLVAYLPQQMLTTAPAFAKCCRHVGRARSTIVCLARTKLPETSQSSTNRLNYQATNQHLIYPSQKTNSAPESNKSMLLRFSDTGAAANYRLQMFSKLAQPKSICPTLPVYLFLPWLHNCPCCSCVKEILRYLITTE